MSAAIFASRRGVLPDAGNVPIKEILSTPREHQGRSGVSAQAVTASVLLSADLGTVRGVDFDDLDPRVVAAGFECLGELRIGKRRKHPLSARRRIGKLRFLLGEVEPFDGNWFPRRAGERDDLLDGFADCRPRLVV